MLYRNSPLTSAQANWLQKYQWSDLRYSKSENLLDRMMSHGTLVFPNNNYVLE